MCATPRTGTDPATGKAYLDRPGTALDEKNWLRSWTNDLYLWVQRGPGSRPRQLCVRRDLFRCTETSATTASGNPKDRFHFNVPNGDLGGTSQSGVQPGYGATFVVVAGTPPRNVVVGYTEPGSPAAIAPASLARGAKILTVDGVDMVNANDQASVDTLNAGLSPQTIGESHTFSILDLGAAASRAVTLVSGNITETPVQNVQTIPTAAGDLVGYVLFNDPHRNRGERTRRCIQSIAERRRA